MAGELGPQALARVPRELAQLERAPPGGVAAWPEGGEGPSGPGSSLSRLGASVEGPEGTPFEGGVFRLSVAIPFRYPFEPPKVRFLTPVYHPNIDSGGRICLDTFNRSWKPSLNLGTVLMTVRLLLAEPNPEDGLMADIAEEYRLNYPLFCEKARSLVREHAMGHRQAEVGTEAPPAAEADCNEGPAGRVREGQPLPRALSSSSPRAAVRNKEGSNSGSPSTAEGAPRREPLGNRVDNAGAAAQLVRGMGGDGLSMGPPAAKRSKTVLPRGPDGGGPERPVAEAPHVGSGGDGSCSGCGKAPKHAPGRLSLRRK